MRTFQASENLVRSIEIMSKEEYEKIKKRVELGEKKIITAGGFSKAPKSWVNKFQELAEQMLLYETENDLLPI